MAPADVRFPYFLGIGWMKRQQYEQAKTEFAEAYVLDPDFIQNGIRNYRYPIVDSKIRKLLSEAININTADKT